MDSMLPPGNSIRVCVHEGETVSVTPRGGGVGVLWMIFVCPWQLCVFVSKVRQLLGGHWECVCSCCVFVCRCLRILSDLVLIHVSPAIRRSSVTSPFSSRWRHQTLLHFPTQPFGFFSGCIIHKTLWVFDTKHFRKKKKTKQQGAKLTIMQMLIDLTEYCHVYWLPQAMERYHGKIINRNNCMPRVTHWK